MLRIFLETVSETVFATFRIYHMSVLPHSLPDPARYQYLLMTGELTAHLNRVDQETREQVETLVKQMVGKQGVNENLKRQDQMRWVRLMNNIKVSAEEIVLKEIIYV